MNCVIHSYVLADPWDFFEPNIFRHVTSHALEHCLDFKLFRISSGY